MATSACVFDSSSLSLHRNIDIPKAELYGCYQCLLTVRCCHSWIRPLDSRYRVCLHPVLHALPVYLLGWVGCQWSAEMLCLVRVARQQLCQALAVRTQLLKCAPPWTATGTVHTYQKRWRGDKRFVTLPCHWGDNQPFVPKANVVSSHLFAQHSLMATLKFCFVFVFVFFFLSMTVS